MTRMRFVIAAAALAAPLALVTTPALASDLSLGPTAIQKIVAEQLFNVKGKWYLVDDGACFAYLDHPKTHLADGRLVLNAHLTAKLGLKMGVACSGADLASNITISAKLAGKGSSLILDDIRFDRIDDSDTKQALQAIQSIAPNALPKSTSIDLLALAKDQAISAAGIPVTVSQFQILNAETRRDAVKITYDMSLKTP